MKKKRWVPKTNPVEKLEFEAKVRKIRDFDWEWIGEEKRKREREKERTVVLRCLSFGIA